MVRRLFVIGLTLVCLEGLSANPARATDTVYTVQVDGRPLTEDPKDTGALSHDGVVYVDVVKITKAYSGLLTFSDGGATVTVSIEKRTAAFTKGRPVARLDTGSMKLSGAPFIYNGDLYVPITAFARFAKSKVKIDKAARVAQLVAPGA